MVWSGKMAGGSFGQAGVSKERAQQYQGRVTLFVVMACLVAAVGGSIFGYDIGISGEENAVGNAVCTPRARW